MELEELMITKMRVARYDLPSIMTGVIHPLQEACGFEFTSKLSRMFTDITVSSQLTQNFNEVIKNITRKQ